TRLVSLSRRSFVATVVPDLALENQAALFALGDPSKEPEFLNEVCAAARCGLLLDLHNAFTNCRNFGLALDDWLAALDLAHVVEAGDPLDVDGRRRFSTSIRTRCASRRSSSESSASRLRSLAPLSSHRHGGRGPQGPRPQAGCGEGELR